MHYRGKASTFPLQDCTVASPIGLKFSLLVNFIKIVTLLRVVSIQVKNIGLWGVPLPPLLILKIFCLEYFLANIHILCEFRATFKGRLHTSQKYRSMGGPLPPADYNTSLFLAKTHILVFVSSKSVKIYSSYRGDKFGIQGTGYSVQINNDPP